MSIFRENSFLPIDRDYTGKFPVTLGAGSYVVEANFEFRDGEADKHVLIGRFCSLAGGIHFFLGHNHHYKNSVTAYPFNVNFVVERMRLAANLPHSGYIPDQIDSSGQNHHQIIIGNDVWIGQGAKFLKGVNIGSGAIIGSYAHVAKDIPPYAIAVGNPARVIKYRFDAETIKKFMAIKWWNWSIDKIYANLPLMYDVDKFLDTHYNLEINVIPYEKMGGGKQIEEYRAEGIKIYSFIADFESPHPMWRKVVRNLFDSNLANIMLIIFASKNLMAANISELSSMVSSANLTGFNKTIRCIPLNDGRQFSPCILRNSTHFITTREMVTLECLDYLYDTEVKIISALDDKIFC